MADVRRQTLEAATLDVPTRTLSRGSMLAAI